MLVLPQKVVVKWTGPNIKYYIGKGYQYTKLFDKLEISAEDLIPSSPILVEAICDYCGEHFVVNYCKIIKNRKTIPKDHCKNCVQKKREETSLLIYGVKNPAQSKKVQDKIKETNINKYGTTCVFQSQQVKNTIKEKYGVEYALQNKNIHLKTQETLFEKHGVRNPSQIEGIQEKIKKNNLEKYNHICTLHSDNFKNKVKNTMLEKYNVDNPMKNEEIRSKVANTCLERYGTKNPSKSDTIKNKIKKTIKLKYGVENVFQNKEIRDKIKNTLRSKYGVSHNFQINIRDRIIKARQTMYKNGTVSDSTPQKYLYNILGGEYNYPVDSCSLDIADLKEMIDIEYDGGGHDLGVKCGYITREEFNKKERVRSYFLKNLGWKEIRIISMKKDLLPSDNMIIKLVSEAKEYLKSGHS